jgi:hypothetical protein
MTGILEQILAELQAISVKLDSTWSPTATGAAADAIINVGAAVVATQPVDPFAMGTPTPTPSPAPTAVNYTDDQIMALIEPYLNNVPVKQDFQVVLQSMGIPKLIEARPDQYNELYQKFTAVIQKHGPQAVIPAASIL